MAKEAPSRGLPKGFGLNIDKTSPVVLGDFIDEALTAPRIPVTPAPPIRSNINESVSDQTRTIELEVPARRTFPNPPAEQLRSGQVGSPSAIETLPPARSGLPSQKQEARAAPRTPRKEISVDTETLSKLDDILNEVRRTSPEPDTRASELMKAIIALLHDARAHFDFSRIPKRGRWGSVGEKQFPGALAAALEQAFTEWVRAKS